jgi:hypothetical protein
MQLGGRVDLTKSNAITGALKLTAESIDVTPYYDLFMEKPKTTTTTTGTTTAPPTTPAPGGVEKEPDPVTMPLKDFTVDLAIGKFYLREIEITNWLATLKLDTSRVVLDPFQLALNGAPVMAATDLDLSVPGYRYDIRATADRIPIEPLANSLAPERRGQTKGDLIARLNIKGAGTTGANLQKSLAGDSFLSFTNAAIQLVGRDGILPTPDWVARYAKMVNPVVPVVSSVLTKVSPFLRVPELTNSPVDWMTVAATMGNGRINVGSCDVVGQAFTAKSGGGIAIAPVLNDSSYENWPFALSIGRSLADRAGITPSDAPADAKYLALSDFLPAAIRRPDLIQIGGTMGAPKTTFLFDLSDPKSLLKNITSIPALRDSQAGGVLQNLGGLFSGERKGATTNAPAGRGATNAPATNPPASPAKGLLDLFNRPK